MDDLHILAFIPARGGSKGVPRKALETLGDHRIISYTIADAQRISGNVRVFVSTDDPEIRDESQKHGADVPFLRPEFLAGDDSRLEDALTYSMDKLKEDERYDPDVLIVMSPTYPFRKPARVEEALNRAKDDEMIFNIGSVAPAPVHPDNFWEVPQHGACRRLKIEKHWAGEPNRLFQTSMSFNIVFLHRSENTTRRMPVMLSDIESIDIDTPYDLELARRVIDEKLYPFKTTQGC